jgi:large subunit ribosomal protein L15
MNLGEIKSASTGRKGKRKRIGRGRGSGTGGTAGKGHKGAKARAGYTRRAGFEGGQMPLLRRIPKRGFNNARWKKTYAVVNVGRLARFADGAEVTPVTVVENGLVDDLGDGLKILGSGDLEVALTVKAHKVSAGARAKIEKAGGKVEIIP